MKKKLAALPGLTFTSGTWLVRKPLYDAMRGNPTRALEVYAANNGIYKPAIADVRSIDVHGRDNTAENAHLIAAAPDLLAALQNYQRLVAYLQRTTNPGEWATHGDWKRLQREADDAIAKAKPKGG